MKIMVIMKGDPAPDQLPTEAVFRAMIDYDQALAEAGVLIAAEGLMPSSSGKRVTLAADGPHVVDGPFAETKELLSGWWLFHVDDMDEAISWLERSPLNGSGMEIELRVVGESEHFGDAFTPALREQDRRVRELVARNAAGAVATTGATT